MTAGSTQLLLWIGLGTNILIIVGLAVLIFRRAPQVTGLIELRSDVERLDRTIQSNDARSFTNAESRGDALRKEVADNIERFSEQLTRNLVTVGDAQKTQLERFATTLSTSSQAFDARIALNADQQQKTLSDFGLANAEGARALRDEVANRLKSATDELRTASESAAALQKERLDELSARLTALSESIAQGFEQFRVSTEAKLGELRSETAEGLKAMRQDNEQKLEQMRITVDEKLQGTLEKRLGESFTLVTQQLRQVHEGLGEMKTLATGVGDLKRVFTNVKSRGTWGETQLASVLEDMLAPDQYARNVRVKEGSNDAVEFCVNIPMMGEHDVPLLLPIDAKFPIEDYERMLASADNGDVAAVEQSAQKLEARFRSCAKEIATKYVVPPRTTEYAIMYVPSEGLYSEIVKRPGLASSIAREFNVVLAGPMNLMAMLNAVHAITRSVIIQQKAGQIAALLLRVQSEFVKYGKAVSVAKRRAVSTVTAMESLDQRQRAMGRTLKGVKSIDGSSTGAGSAGDPIGLISYSEDGDPESERLIAEDAEEGDDSSVDAEGLT